MPTIESLNMAESKESRTQQLIEEIRAITESKFLVNEPLPRILDNIHRILGACAALDREFESNVKDLNVEASDIESLSTIARIVLSKFNKQVFVIVGPPGSGKTTLLQKTKELFELNKPKLFQYLQNIDFLGVFLWEQAIAKSLKDRLITYDPDRLWSRKELYIVRSNALELMVHNLSHSWININELPAALAVYSGHPDLLKNEDFLLDSQILGRDLGFRICRDIALRKGPFALSNYDVYFNAMSGGLFLRTILVYGRDQINWRSKSFEEAQFYAEAYGLDIPSTEDEWESQVKTGARIEHIQKLEKILYSVIESAFRHNKFSLPGPVARVILGPQLGPLYYPPEDMETFLKHSDTENFYYQVSYLANRLNIDQKLVSGWIGRILAVPIFLKYLLNSAYSNEDPNQPTFHGIGFDNPEKLRVDNTENLLEILNRHPLWKKHIENILGGPQYFQINQARRNDPRRRKTPPPPLI
jgi:hypothetical protein